MKKWVIVSALVLLVIILGGGAFAWYAMQQPLYSPGMVRAGRNPSPLVINAVAVQDKDFWKVEEKVSLHHFVQGGGKGTNVLVIHGGPGMPFESPIAGLEPLTGSYTFHYYDQRGSGESSRPIMRFTFSSYWENLQTLDKALGPGAQIADIERVRQILGEEKLILVGHSFGGFLAALYAAEFPEHTRALVLVAPAEMLVMPPASGGLFEQVRPLLPESMQAEYRAFLSRYLNYGSIFSKNEADLAGLNAEFARYYTAAAERKGFRVPIPSRPELVGGWMVHAMYLSMGMQHDYRNALKRVNVPVLVVHGGKDLQPEVASRTYVEAFPNAEFRVIENAGHFIFNDRPDEFAGAVREFLARVK
jgi:proline iminopeptidase